MPHNRQLLHGHCHDEKTSKDRILVVGASSGTSIEWPNMTQTPNNRASRPELGRNRMFWIQWVLASGCGGLLSGVVMVWMWWIGALLLGTLFSLPQWLLLRSIVRRASRWVVFTTGGVLIAWVAGALFGYVAGGAFAGALAGMGPASLSFILAVALGLGIGGAAAGAVVGLVQRSVVREFLPRADSWVPSSSLAGVGLALSAVAPLSITGLNNSWVWTVSGVLGGSVYGIITATALMRTARAIAQRDSSPASEDNAHLEYP